MKPKLTEKQVLDKLEIDNFRQLSKDKVMSFASLLKDMDPEVAKVALSQFPDFAKVSLAALNDYKEIMHASVNSNDKSSDNCYAVYNEVVSALQKCLDQDNIDFEEKKYYIDKMMDISKMAESKDSENKHFNWKVISAGAAATAGVLLVGASILGGKFDIK